MKKAGTVAADYGQFYVYDAGEGLADPRRAEVFNRQSLGRGLAVARTFMAVFTIRQAGDVPIEVEALGTKPLPELDAWDHVVEGSIEVPSGRLVIGSWDDTGPTLEVTVPPGSCRVRVRAHGLDETDDPGEERDAYTLQVWTEPPSPPALLKGWAGYEARIRGMP